MRTVIIHGQSHKGSTYHIAHSLAEKIGGEITEIFLPKDFGEFCVGCVTCFTDGEKKCPHYAKLQHITETMTNYINLWDASFQAINKDLSGQMSR